MIKYPNGEEGDVNALDSEASGALDIGSACGYSTRTFLKKAV